MIARLLRFLVVFLAFCPLFGQGLPRAQHFSKSDFGGQNQTWAIDRAADGALFFANNAGLLEFDGSRWRLFPLPSGQVTRAVACSADGERVFVGGFADFGFFEKSRSKKWVYRSLAAALGDDSPARREEFWNILATENGAIFQSFGVVYRFDGQKTEKLDAPAPLMFLQKAQGKILFQAIGKGLFELAADGSCRFLSGSEKLAEPIVAFILEDRKAVGSLLVGTKNDGIFRFRGGAIERLGGPVFEKIRLAQPNKAVRLPDGSLAIGTILGGVFVLDSLEKLVFQAAETAGGLQNATVLSMLAAPDGSLWLGLDKGIDCLRTGLPLRFFGGLGTAYAAAIFDQKLFVGTNRGLFWRAENEKSDAPFRFVAGSQGQVWQLEAFDGHLVVGHNDGTFGWRDGFFRCISGRSGAWQTVKIGSRLVQATYTGLDVFEKNGRGDWAFSHSVAGFSQSIRSLAFDSASGFWWLAHPNRGLWRARLTADFRKIEELKAFGPADGLRKNGPFRLVRLGEQLFAEADSSAFRLKNGLIDHETRETSASARLAGGSAGERFFSFSDELLFQNGAEKPVALPVALIKNWETALALDSNRYFFGLDDGFAIWEKTRPLPAARAEARVAAIEILGKKCGWFFPDFGKKEGETEPFAAFEADQNDLRIYFSEPSGGQKKRWFWAFEGSKTEPCHRLEGDVLELNDLAAGRYRLFFQSSESSREGAFAFEIQKRWWRSWPAVLTWAAMASGLLFLLERAMRRRLGRQKAQLEREAARDLAEQRAEAEKALLQTEIDSKSRDLSSSTLSLIRKNEALLELKSELERLAALPVRDRERLERLIDAHVSSDADWAVFEGAFNQVHDAFFKKMKAAWPELTSGDLRLAALLKLNLSSKELASLLGISVRGVENKRYRLRKKLGLGEEIVLTEFLMGF